MVYETTLARLPEQLERCRADLRAATSAVAALPGVERAVEDLRKRVSAAAQHAALLPRQLAEAGSRRSWRSNEAEQLTEVWFGGAAERLEGIGVRWR